MGTGKYIGIAIAVVIVGAIAMSIYLRSQSDKAFNDILPLAVSCISGKTVNDLDPTIASPEFNRYTESACKNVESYESKWGKLPKCVSERVLGDIKRITGPEKYRILSQRCDRQTSD